MQTIIASLNTHPGNAPLNTHPLNANTTSGLGQASPRQQAESMTEIRRGLYVGRVGLYAVPPWTRVLTAIVRMGCIHYSLS
jgi:hypothetical protein